MNEWLAFIVISFSIGHNLFNREYKHKQNTTITACCAFKMMYNEKNEMKWKVAGGFHYILNSNRNIKLLEQIKMIFIFITYWTIIFDEMWTWTSIYVSGTMKNSTIAMFNWECVVYREYVIWYFERRRRQTMYFLYGIRFPFLSIWIERRRKNSK